MGGDEGGGTENSGNPKEKKVKHNTEWWDVSEKRGVAGRRGGQTGGSGSQGGMVEVTGNGPKQHAITSHNGFFLCFFPFCILFIFFF